MYVSNIFNRVVELGFAAYNPMEHKENFHLSAVVNKNKIVAIAANSARTHTVNLLNPKFGYDGKNLNDSRGSCSELKALLQFKNKTNIDARKCTLINIRINRNLELANSCPCAGCKNLLRYFDLKAVYYTNEKGIFEKY